MNATHKSRTQQLQDLALRYREAGHPWPARTITIARWAIDAGLCQPEPSTFERQLAQDLGRAFREDYFDDPQGRRVRRNHPFPVKQVIDGEAVQTMLWGDMASLTRDQMKMSLGVRRHGIFRDCKQLDTDRESYNDNFNGGDAIMLSLNFEEDVEESKNPTEYGPDFAAEYPTADDDEDDDE